MGLRKGIFMYLHQRVLWITLLCSAVYRRGQKAAQSCSCPIMPTFLATLINKMHPTESKMFVTPKNHTKTGKAVGRGGGQGVTQGFATIPAKIWMGGGDGVRQCYPGSDGPAKVGWMVTSVKKEWPSKNVTCQPFPHLPALECRKKEWIIYIKKPEEVFLFWCDLYAVALVVFQPTKLIWQNQKGELKVYTYDTDFFFETGS